MTDQFSQPAAPYESEPDGGSGKRLPVIVGVSVLVAGVLGAGAFAATKFLGGGAQPAQALPDSVIAYASIDIDPGASQKIEAIKMMRKFPELKKLIKVDAEDDIRKRIFDEAIKDSECKGKLSFDKDVEPWLGSRMAVGAADLGGKEPSPVAALAVKDEDGAADGLKKLRSCGSTSSTADDDFAYDFHDGYMLMSEGKSEVAKLISGAKKATLADSAGFKEWSDKAGGEGIVNFYVSPKAGELILDGLPAEVKSQVGDADKALKDFKGMGGALRFDDGGLELEMAAGGGKDMAVDGELGDGITDLPKDTAVAFGIGVPDDFVSKMLDQVTTMFGGQADSTIAQIEAQTGLSVPEDIQTLLGDAVVVALGGDAPANLRDVTGPSDLPIGLKIIGDSDEIAKVISKAEERAGQKLSDADIVQGENGDAYVLASSKDFADALKKEGGLGDNDAFKKVIPEGGDSAFALFVDFNSSWRDAIIDTFASDAGSSKGVAANVKPLEAFGVSSWRDDDIQHVLVKLTTD